MKWNKRFVESVLIGLSSKKKKIFSKVCEVIEHSIDKLYKFNIKALKDNEIFDEEIIKAKKTIDECKNNIKKIKTQLKIENVEKEITANLKKEIRKEFKNDLKEKLNALKLTEGKPFKGKLHRNWLNECRNLLFKNVLQFKK